MFNYFISKNVINDSFDQKVKQLTNQAGSRQIRSTCDDTSVITIFDDPTLAIIFIIICLVLLLLLLGIIKGLVGLYCCPPIGMCGLGALIDLPRPLEYYQEPELQDFPVKYDIIGWPVHPQTGKRTVRAISLRTEFCLNTIFFLTYPVIMLITLMSICCFSKVYDTDDSDKDKNFKETHTIMLTDCPSFMCNKNNVLNYKHEKKKTHHVYTDDSTEETDTHYVLDQMRKSEESLRKNKK